MTEATTPHGASHNTARDAAPKGAMAKATATLHDARDAAGDVAARAVDAIEANPLAIVAGGIAAGLVAGALIPRSEREKEALAPLGKKIAEGASAAVKAARETGKAQLSTSVMSVAAAKEGARAVLDSALQAARTGSATDATTTKTSQGGSSQGNPAKAGATHATATQGSSKSA